MSLLEKIKQDQLQSRKDRTETKTSLLTTLYSEAAMIGKNQNRETTDAEVISTIKKFIKNNVEFAAIASSQTLLDNLKQERDILESYLPKQLNVTEIAEIMSKIDCKDLGSVMKYFRANYEGQYNGADVKYVFETCKNML